MRGVRRHLNQMLKLYKVASSNKHYWETWENDDQTHTVHWGVLGETGRSKTVKSSILKEAKVQIQAEVDALVEEGFAPVPPEAHRILLIEYEVDGFGSDDDLEKRYRLQDRMDETLGWTGLGNCDGGSTGTGTMEVCCYVVDFDVAKRVIENNLKNTEFADYTKIYDERADDA